ncbi:MAG: DNA repair protein RecN [Acholeplasma sp.]|nr:DNA repair protein RecN [Acholeplasma sp.]
MLKRLKIENLAIIEDLEVEFECGMTALTGQTGAGKSLLIDSLKLLFGARADSDLIRFKEEEALVEGVFVDLNESLKAQLNLMGLLNEPLVIKRVINRNNKNALYVNQKPITLSELKKLTYYLGDIHEQHDITKLLDPKLQLSLVDQMGNQEIEPLYNQYQLTKEKYFASKSKYQSALKDKQKKEVELESLKDIQDELSKMKLDVNEPIQLALQIEKLSHQEKIVYNVNKSFELLEDLYQKGDLYEASKALFEIKDFDELYLLNSERLEELYYELEGMRSDLKKSLSLFDYYNENELNDLEERLHALKTLEKKHSKSIPELIDYLKEVEEKILISEDYEGYLSKLKDETETAFKTVFKHAEALRKQRMKLSKLLENELIKELNQLDLEKVRFEISFEPLKEEVELLEDGIDVVTFNIGLNEGEPLKPLYKTASGGELSRFMLALKIVFSRIQGLNLVVFDEIDMGISGKTASKVANRIHHLSKNLQVLSITHLPQVAAVSQNHYHIIKKIKDHRTTTTIEVLSLDRRIEVLAEMLSGERIDLYAIEHAKALLTK